MFQTAFVLTERHDISLLFDNTDQMEGMCAFLEENNPKFKQE
jgi:hypothetical protein